MISSPLSSFFSFAHVVCLIQISWPLTLSASPCLSLVKFSPVWSWVTCLHPVHQPPIPPSWYFHLISYPISPARLCSTTFSLVPVAFILQTAAPSTECSSRTVSYQSGMSQVLHLFGFNHQPTYHTTNLSSPDASLTQGTDAPEVYCTLPHCIELLLTDSQEFFSLTYIPLTGCKKAIRGTQLCCSTVVWWVHFTSI